MQRLVDDAAAARAPLALDQPFKGLTVGRGQIERAREQPHGVAARDVRASSLELADTARADASPLGQLLLCQSGGPPMVA